MDKPIVLVDLEGTLTDSDHRIKYWEAKDYDTWNNLLYADRPNSPVIDLVVELSMHCRIFIATAKPVQYKKEIHAWLDEHLPIKPDVVMMRPEGNKETSPDLKESWVISLAAHNQTIALAIDDRSDVINMYRDKGLITIDASNVFNISDIVNGVLSGIEQPTPIRKNTVPDMLRESAAIYEERNKTYGNSYKEFGTIMAAFFPYGVVLNNSEEMNRHAVLTLMMAKLQRYCNNFHKGGHKDSLIDLSTYSAMLNELDGE